VRSYMAHHQGMIMLAVVNHLAGGRIVERFHRDRRLATVAHLLYEQVPSDVQPEQLPPPGREVALPLPTSLVTWTVPARTEHPETHVLGNGRYRVMLTNAGGGASFYEGLAVTRSRGDPTLEEGGTWIYVRDEESGEVWSNGLMPAGGDPVEAS